MKAHLNHLNFFNTGMNYKNKLEDRVDKIVDSSIKITPALTTRSK